MLLAVDIGNTTITFGVFKQKRLLRRFSLQTCRRGSAALQKKLRALALDAVIVSSVVPGATAALKKDLKKIFPGLAPLVLGRNIKAPIKNLYRDPAQVGQDRLANAYAAFSRYARAAVVVDFGTAVTFDVISPKGAYLGGMILPGLGICLDALAVRTALLPKVALSLPAEFIGRDTRNSMLSGVVHGFAALTDELAKRIKKKIGPRAKVIGTGGNIGLIARYCRAFDLIDPDLTLKGLNLIYNKVKQNKP
ncbi:MAG TPA: type III pantothenate kinase [Patescibacteria group bacterium]|nr:type III pantothenate kinase [Patescibacteria group bacterium]